jgi:TRAP-type C4-dicarboxylate transport system substrate-binding protein
MNTLTIPFIWCVLQVTLLTTAAAALHLLLRRFSPAARSLVPLVALLLVAALTLLALSPWPRLSYRIRRVKEETGHDISFTTAWSGTVAKADGVSDAVQSGILDIGITAVTFEQSRLGLLNYGYWFPFTTPDHVLNTKVSMDLLKEDPA